MKTPIVTIVGRPNVGKSTLFNKIAGSRIAITAEEAGTTRDRIFYTVQNKEMDFFLVDTGGLEFGKGESSIEDDMQLQARVAIDEADLILFVVDSKEDLIDQDFKAAEMLRKKTNKKPVFLVINKCDNFLEESELASFYSLGIGDPHQMSALHRTGIDTLLSQIIEELKQQHFLTKNDPAYKKILEEERERPSIVLAGKPNVGKSSLINALLNKDKLIVSETPGTTRDATDSIIRHKGKEYNFIDTAGLRRRGKIGRGIEKFSTLRSMAAIERCEIVLLVIDTSEPISHQDKQIASYIIDAGKGLMILANKWDLKNEDSKNITEDRRRAKYINYLKYEFPFLSWAPLIFTSAVTKKNLSHVFEQIKLIQDERQKRIPTAQLNTFVQKLIIEHKPTGAKKRNPKIYYITQPEINPPHFIIFINRKNAFHFSYLRYIENRLREKFAFTGTTIRLEYKEKKKD